MVTIPKGKILLCTVRPKNITNIYECQTSAEKIGKFADVYIRTPVKNVLVTRYNSANENTLQIVFLNDTVCKISEDFKYIGKRRHKMFRLLCDPAE